MGTGGNWRGTEVFPSGAGRSPPPTRGAEQGGASGGGVRLGCGFRQPNSVSEFGASVKVTPPYGCNAGGAQQRADVGIGPYALRGTARRGRRALRMVAESHRDCPGQRRTAERLRRGWEEGVEIEAGIIPEGGINVGQSLSHGEAVTAPFTQGSLRRRGMRIAASALRASSQ